MTAEPGRLEREATIADLAPPEQDAEAVKGGASSIVTDNKDPDKLRAPRAGVIESVGVKY